MKFSPRLLPEEIGIHDPSYLIHISIGFTGIRSTEATQCLLLEPRAMVVFTDEAYIDYLHSIDAVLEESFDTCCNLHLCHSLPPEPLIRRTQRISITCRKQRKEEGASSVISF